MNISETARIFFTDDEDIYPVLQTALTRSYRELVNVKNEQEFLCWTLKIILQDCSKLKEKYAKDINRKIGGRETAISITDKVAISESTIGNLEYQAYRRNSIVEEYITSIEPAYRIPAFLYYYANLSTQEISKIIEKCRIKIYEMIKNKEVDL